MINLKIGEVTCFDLKTAFPKNFIPTSFTNFCVVIATLLITVKLNATSMLGPENI